MRVLVGIDDTDNLESRGTGFRARQLAELLSAEGADVRSVTRHQLLVDPRIPYTSHNSSACLDLVCAQVGPSLGIKPGLGNLAKFLGLTLQDIHDVIDAYRNP